MCSSCCILAVVLIVRFGSRDQALAKRSDRSSPSSTLIAAVTGAPYWIDSKAGLMDKAKELGVTATFTGPADRGRERRRSTT